MGPLPSRKVGAKGGLVWGRFGTRRGGEEIGDGRRVGWKERLDAVDVPGEDAERVGVYEG